MTKRALSLLLALLLLLLPLPCHAAQGTDGSLVWQNAGTGFECVLEDDADLLSVEERDRLLEEMKPLTAYGHVMFKTVNENADTVEDFAHDYYHTRYALGEDGTFLLIDMDHRVIYIFSDGSVYGVLTDVKAEIITDNCYAKASDGDFYGCASRAFSQMHSLLRGEKILEPMKYVSNALLSVTVSLFLCYSLARGMSGLKPAAPKRHIRLAEKELRIDRKLNVTKKNTTKRLIPASSGDYSGSSSSGSSYSGSSGSSSGSSSSGSSSSSGHSGGGGGHRF